MTYTHILHSSAHKQRAHHTYSPFNLLNSKVIYGEAATELRRLYLSHLFFILLSNAKVSVCDVCVQSVCMLHTYDVECMEEVCVVVVVVDIIVVLLVRVVLFAKPFVYPIHYRWY